MWLETARMSNVCAGKVGPRQWSGSPAGVQPWGVEYTGVEYRISGYLKGLFRWGDEALLGRERGGAGYSS